MKVLQFYLRKTNEHPDTGWFSTPNSAFESADAWLKIKCRDSWFSMAADDVQSSASFPLLGAVIDSVAGSAAGVTHLL